MLVPGQLEVPSYSSRFTGKEPRSGTQVNILPETVQLKVIQRRGKSVVFVQLA